MLTGKQFMLKVKNSAGQFLKAADLKQWNKARSIYNRTITACVYMELDELEMIEIFGNRPYKEKEEDEKDGLFPEILVEKVRWECIKRGIEREEPIFQKGIR